MAAAKLKQHIVGIAVSYREKAGKTEWFLTKEEDDSDWEFPRAIARTGESSVRAAIRVMGDQGGMTVKMLEEAGRAGGSTSVNNDIIPVRYLYYLGIVKDASGEPIGFSESGWFEYSKAVRKLASKRDMEMLKNAKNLMKEMEKDGRMEALLVDNS